MDFNIIRFDRKQHEDQVVELWKNVFGYESGRNDPYLTVEKKEAVSDGLFFVAKSKIHGVVGTVMCGYDGHRGWIYSLVVRPEFQNQGIGRELMIHAEHSLKKLGCAKINLQIIESNEQVQVFYQSLGYKTEKRISMGKEIPENISRGKGKSLF